MTVLADQSRELVATTVKNKDKSRMLSKIICCDRQATRVGETVAFQGGSSVENGAQSKFLFRPRAISKQEPACMLVNTGPDTLDWTLT